MEACGGAHEWGRELMKLGHEVRLLAPKIVRPFVQRNKTDAADAQAIWTAARQPGVRFVAVKSEAQHVVLALHPLRGQLMKMGIMQTNELRGLASEFGIVLPEGHPALMKELPAALRSAQAKLPAVFIDRLHEQVRRIEQLQTDIDALERRLAEQLRGTPACNTRCGDPWHGFDDRHRGRRQHGLADRLQEWARIRRLNRIGAASDRHRRSRAATGHQQARRRVPANAVDARRSGCGAIGPRYDVALVGGAAQAPALQRRSRRRSEQDRAHDLGTACQWPKLACRCMAGRMIVVTDEEGAA